MPRPDQCAREILIAYLYMKADLQDWHGVSDAANDLREMDAAHRALEGQPQKQAVHADPAAS